MLYKEAIESALEATNYSNWETVIGSFLLFDEPGNAAHQQEYSSPTDDQKETETR